jgi:hypothetical protein
MMITRPLSEVSIVEKQSALGPSTYVYGLAADLDLIEISQKLGEHLGHPVWVNRTENHGTEGRSRWLREEYLSVSGWYGHEISQWLVREEVIYLNIEPYPRLSRVA